MQENERRVVTTEQAGGTEVATTGPQPLMVNPAYIENTVRSLALLQTLVRDVLKKDRDYGAIKGTGDFLWDPGAGQIVGAFNCHFGQRRILHMIDDGKKISLIVEVPVISNVSGFEVGSGIGAASTLETKHKYRWVNDPSEWGYFGEAAETLKTRTNDWGTQYRILNPEHDDLLNTLVKMASKRAEVDGAEALPAVSSTLKDLFEGREFTPGPRRGTPSELDENSPHWTSFWTEVRALGIEKDKVHEMLGVTSMKDWLKAGKSLNEAVRMLTKKVGSKPDTTTVAWDTITKDNITDYAHLEHFFQQLTGKQPDAMYVELGGGGRAAMTVTAWEAFQQLKEIYKEPPAEA